MRFLALVATAAVVVGGCGREAGNPPVQGGGAASRCETAPAALVQAISTGLTITGGGSIRNAKAVKSAAFEKVWFVSADLEGSGLEGSDDIATWATNGLNGVGMIFAVGAVANEFSDWGDGGTAGAKLSLSDDGAQASIDCAKGGSPK